MWNGLKLPTKNRTASLPSYSFVLVINILIMLIMLIMLIILL